MKIERTRNATRNIFFATILKVYQILVPFLMRTIMVYFLGEQYLGLNSLFTSILQVLNLAELGVGSAMVFSMYKPIAEDDEVTICALMKLYKIYYRVIGLIVLVAGLIVMPFIPNLIKSDMPADVNIYVLYLMNLMATVLSYWLFAYKNSIIGAHQRGDVTSKITLVTNTINYIFAICVIVFLKNYYLYIIVLLITQVMNNLITAYYANKMYPQYKAKGDLPAEQKKAINKRIGDLFTVKIATIIMDSADTIVISAYLGLSVLAIYQNYFYIISSIMGFIGIIFGACTAGIGNSLIVETTEKNMNDFNKFTFLISWITGFCTVCFLCLFQPFMKIWMGENRMLEMPIVVCLCIYFFTREIQSVMVLYKDAGGMWHDDRLRVFLTSAANLIMNLIFVNFCGLYGVILSTVLSLVFVGTPWLFHNVFKNIFPHKYSKAYIKKIAKYTFVILVTCIFTYWICCFICLNMWLDFIIKLVVCCIIPNVIFYIIYRKDIEFYQCIELIDKVTKNKFKFLKNKKR